MSVKASFPLQGVIGVVANSTDEITLAAQKNLQCVELRADLLLDAGLPLAQVLATIDQAKQNNLATLFTLRHPSHGGKFPGTEDERVTINQQALDAGADIIDLEWNTDAAATMLSKSAPLILSYHDFNNMPDKHTLTELSRQMEAAGSLAIKVVPTANTVTDAARMLQWAEDATADTVRIGFAMGQSGASSRILTIARGAPITYASFSEAVAPGQVAIDDLINVYHAATLNSQTMLVAVTGEHNKAESLARKLNLELQNEGSNDVAIGFTPEQLDDLQACREILGIREIHNA